MPTQVEPDKLHLASLERFERRLELLLRDLRIFRSELEEGVKDRGVLGSRGLTEYIMGLLKASESGYSINHLLITAEEAGYEIPTRRVLSKRLTARAYRVGDIGYDAEREVWFWKGER